MLIPLLFAALIGAVPPANKAPEPLDQKGIHHNYNEGNFDSVVKDIESFQKTHTVYAEADSIFIAKHLAVVYSANPKTREKGKYYMFRLLELLPSAKLVDMYVSDEIDRIFDKVREEFTMHQKDFGVDTTKMALPDRAPANQNTPGVGEPARAPEKSAVAAQSPAKTGLDHKQKVWLAAAAGAVTVGLAATYFIATSSSSSKSDVVYDVP